MARPVELRLDIIADGDGVKQGVREAENALDGLGDAAKDAEKALSGIEDTSIEVEVDAKTDVIDDLRKNLDRLRDQMRDRLEVDITADTSDIEKDIRKTERAIKTLERTARTSGRKMGSNLGDGFKRASRDMDEFNDEARQNFGETASNFSGDFESAIDLVRDTLGGLASNLGGLKGIGLGVAAIGIGAIVGGLQKAADEANEMKENVAELAASRAGIGGLAEQAEAAADAFSEWGQVLGDPKSWFEPFQREAVTNLELVANSAEVTGVSLSEMFSAVSNPDVGAGIAQLESMIATAEEGIKSNTGFLDFLSFSSASQKQAAVDAKGALEDQLSVMEAVEQQEKAAADAIGATVGEYRRLDPALAAALEHMEGLDRIDGGGMALLTGYAQDLGANLDDLNDAAQEADDALDALFGQQDSNVAIAEFNLGLAEQKKALQELKAQSDLTTTSLNGQVKASDELTVWAGNYARDAEGVVDTMVEQGKSGAEVAAQVSNMRDSFVDLLVQQGLSSDMANQLADDYGLIPSEVETTVTAKNEASAEIERVQGILDKVEGVHDAIVRGDTADANAKLDALNEDLLVFEHPVEGTLLIDDTGAVYALDSATGQLEEYDGSEAVADLLADATLTEQEKAFADALLGDWDSSEGTATVDADNGPANREINEADGQLGGWDRSKGTAKVDANNRPAKAAVGVASGYLTNWDRSSGTADARLSDQASGPLSGIKGSLRAYGGSVYSATARVNTGPAYAALRALNAAARNAGTPRVAYGQGGAGGITYSAEPIGPSIPDSPAAVNVVKVNIAGREVNPIVEDAVFRSRSSYETRELTGQGARF